MITNRKISVITGVLMTFILIVCVHPIGLAQSTAPPDTKLPQTGPSLSRYLDQTTGMTADEAVAYALTHNAELEATRKEIDAAKSMVKQARLRENPMLDVEGKRQAPPGRDNTVMA